MWDYLSKTLNSLAEGDLAMQVVLLGHAKAFITSFTAGLTLIIAILLFSFHREALKGEKWISYFAWAFVVFTGQYTLQAVTARWQEAFLLTEPSFSKNLGAWGLCLGSPVNTVLLLAAARLLLDRRPAVPKWALPIAGIAASFTAFPLVAGVEEMVWTRLPDALFAAVTLGALAWALFTNIDPQWYRFNRPFDIPEPSWPDRFLRWRKLLLALIVLAVILFYALINLGFAFNPVLAERHSEIFKGLEGNTIGPLEGFDTIIFATAIPLKLFLFLAVFYLIVRNLVFLSPQAMGRTLHGVRSEKLVYHSSQGIVRAIGKSLDADAVHLYFKLPGNLKRRRAVAWWCWQVEPEGAAAKDRVRTPLPPETTIAGWILRHGELLKIKRCAASSPAWDQPRENGTEVEDPGIRSAVAVPIFYHGSIIGGISIGWKSAYTLTATAIQRVGFVADMLAPVVESRRELSALYFLGRQFQEQDVAAQEGEGEALKRLTQVLLPTLSPAAIGIAVEVGFRAFFAYGDERIIRSGDTDTGAYERRQNDGHRPIDVAWVAVGGSRERCEARLRGLVPLREGVDGNERYVEDLKIEGVGVGTLVLLTRGPKQRQARPHVVSDWLLRQTVSILLADAIFDATRVWLWSILNRLQTTLNEAGSSSIMAWYEAVCLAADDAGASWVVAELENERRQYDGDSAPEVVRYGEDSAPRIVRYGEDAARDVVRGLPELGQSRAVGSLIHHFELDDQRHGAHHVVRLALTSEAALYLGIPRAGFGIELRPNWPWRIFLERFAIAAGAGLTRMRIGVLNEDELNRHGVMTASVITGSLVHRLSNMAADLGSDLYGLSEARNKYDLAEPIERRLDSMARVVGELSQVTSAIHDATSLDQSRPCQVSDVVSRFERLFRPGLDQKHIALEIEVRADLEADVPKYVLSHAISSLISNSLYAILSSETVGGRIRVVAEDHGGIIRFKVIDNGPGVDPKMLKKVFEPHVSTKPGSKGLGLYLARRTLQEDGGDLLLTESRPGNTEFTMILPKG